jgi:hypothetical protein
MKIGDLVKMDYEEIKSWGAGNDYWGVGMIVEIQGDETIAGSCDDVHVLWSDIGLSWEMVGILELIDASC